MKFRAIEKRVNTSIFIEFLKLLIASAKRPDCLILDNSSVHRSSEVQDFVESKIDRQTTTGEWDLYKRVTRVMRSLQRCPEKIQSFLRHP